MAKVTSGTETITPKRAMEWIEASDKVKQRPLLQTRVDFLVNQIKRGAYELNGEAVIISSDGTVMDGQHRLWAVIQADMAIESVVVRGVDPNTFDTIDSTGGRSASDVLAILFKNTKQPPGAMRVNVLKMIGPALSVVLNCNRSTGEFKQFKGMKARLHNHVVIEYVEKHPILVQQAIFLDTLPSLPRVPKSGCLAILHLCEPAFQGVVREFVTAVYSDVKHEEGSPALALRRKALQEPPGHDFVNTADRLGFLIKAWNFWSANYPVAVLKSNISEGFPKLRLKPEMKSYITKPSIIKDQMAKVEARKDLPKNIVGGVQKGALKAKLVPLPPKGLKGGL
jgi:hypothetical protein